MLDVESGESKDLLAFQPTDQFLSILPYFDQYHQSATIWSPDNFNLVLPLIAGDGTPSLAIVPASGLIGTANYDPGLSRLLVPEIILDVIAMVKSFACETQHGISN